MAKEGVYTEEIPSTIAKHSKDHFDQGGNLTEHLEAALRLSLASLYINIISKAQFLRSTLTYYETRFLHGRTRST